MPAMRKIIQFREFSTSDVFEMSRSEREAYFEAVEKLVKDEIGSAPEQRLSKHDLVGRLHEKYLVSRRSLVVAVDVVVEEQELSAVCA